MAGTDYRASLRFQLGIMQLLEEMLERGLQVSRLDRCGAAWFIEHQYG